MAKRSRRAHTPILIADPDALETFVATVASGNRVAVDTEAASYHKYHDRVYLVQISTDRETAIVDPLAVPHLKPVGALLENPAIEATFHDADYDLRVLDRDYGFRVTPVFDTRIAAQLLGEPGVGLGALLQAYFGIELNKRMQRADWSRRPLTDEMIAYAAADTSHLLALRDTLEGKLKTAGRLHWAEEEFARLTDVRWTRPEENGFFRVRGAKALKGRQLSVLRSVYEWREAKAANLDRAPFRVLGNDALMALAKAVPSGKRSMSRVDGLPPSALKRYGDELLAAVQEGAGVPPERWPTVERGRRPRTNKAAEARFGRLKTLRNARAQKIGLEPGVVCPNGTLLAIARAEPEAAEGLDEIGELRSWQREVLGEAALLEATAGPD